MNGKNYITVMQFAVCTADKNAVKIGKSAILQPKPNFKGGSIKWFDDRKLMRGGDVK